MTLTLTATCTGNTPNAHLVAYGPSFVPGDISQNYRGDIGSSTGNSGSQSMSLDMGANETIQVVVQAVQNTTGGAGTCSYSLTSPELDEFVAVPTLTEWAMIGLSLALAAMGGLIVWSRRKGLAEA